MAYKISHHRLLIMICLLYIVPMKEASPIVSNLSNTPRPLVERHHRVDPAHHFRHYFGGFNLRNTSYVNSVIYSGSPFLIAAVATIGFFVFLLVIALTPPLRRIKAPIPHNATFLGLLGFAALVVGFIAVGSAIAFFILQNTYYARIFPFSHSLVTKTAELANERVQSAADAVEEAANFLITRAGPPISYYSITNSTRTQIHQVNNVRRSLLANQPWNAFFYRFHQFRHTSIIWQQLALGYTFVPLSVILIIMGIGMVIGRIIWSEAKWTRSNFYTKQSFIALIVIAGLLIVGGYSYGMLQATKDAFDALNSYGSPFNTTFDLEGFFPCGELEARGEQLYQNVKRLGAMEDSAWDVNQTLSLNSTHMNSIHRPENGWSSLLSSLTATLPEIQAMLNCSTILDWVHLEASINRDHVQDPIKGFTVCLMILIVALAIFSFIVVLIGAIARPLPPVLPSHAQLITPPTESIPTSTLAWLRGLSKANTNIASDVRVEEQQSVDPSKPDPKVDP